MTPTPAPSEATKTGEKILWLHEVSIRSVKMAGLPKGHSRHVVRPSEIYIYLDLDYIDIRLDVWFAPHIYVCNICIHFIYYTEKREVRKLYRVQG